MADIELRYDHDRSEDELYRKADQLFRNHDRVDSVRWDDDQREATIEGSGFSARATIDADEVVCTVELSMMAKPFKDTIEDQLRSEMDAIFRD